jgi:hypothetical protein
MRLVDSGTLDKIIYLIMCFDLIGLMICLIYICTYIPR